MKLKLNASKTPRLPKSLKFFKSLICLLMMLAIILLLGLGVFLYRENQTLQTQWAQFQLRAQAFQTNIVQRLDGIKMPDMSSERTELTQIKASNQALEDELQGLKQQVKKMYGDKAWAFLTEWQDLRAGLSGLSWNLPMPNKHRSQPSLDSKESGWSGRLHYAWQAFLSQVSIEKFNPSQTHLLAVNNRIVILQRIQLWIDIAQRAQWSGQTTQLHQALQLIEKCVITSFKDNVQRARWLKQLDRMV